MADVRGPGVVRTGALSMVGMAALGLTRLIHGSLVVRATDAQTYGRVGVLIAVATIASLLLPAGVSSALPKFVPFLHGRGDPRAARAAYRLLSRLGLVGAVVFGLAAAAVAAAVLDLSVRDTAQLAALAIAFSLYSIDKAALYAYQRVPAYARLELVTSALAVLATVVVVAAGWPVYLAPLVLGYTAFAVGARLLLRDQVARAPRSGGPRQPVTGLGPVPLAEVFGYVALACLGTLASQGFLQGTQLLAEAFATPTEVGYFAAAVTLVTPMYFLPRALSVALFPTMARAHGAGDVAAVRRHADLSTRALFVVLAPVFAAAILLAPEVLLLYGGSALTAGSGVLQFMLAATFLAVCAVAAVNTLSSGDGWQVRTPVASAVAGALTGLAVVALLGRPLGALGVGIGYLAGTAVTAGGPVVAVWRRHAMAWQGPVLTALGVVAAALTVGAVVTSVQVPPGTRVALDVGCALAVVAASVGLLAGHLRTILSDVRNARVRI